MRDPDADPETATHVLLEEADEVSLEEVASEDIADDPNFTPL